MSINEGNTIMKASIQGTGNTDLIKTRLMSLVKTFLRIKVEYTTKHIQPGQPEEKKDKISKSKSKYRSCKL